MDIQKKLEETSLSRRPSCCIICMLLAAGAAGGGEIKSLQYTRTS